MKTNHQGNKKTINISTASKTISYDTPVKLNTERKGSGINLKMNLKILDDFKLNNTKIKEI